MHIFENLLKDKAYSDDFNLLNSFANRLNNVKKKKTKKIPLINKKLGEALRKHQKYDEAENTFKESIKYKLSY